MRQKGDLRDYLAAERTFLAWIRTGLALMGFGFVVARFGIFLQRLQLFQKTPVESSSGPSLWFGTALIAVGIVVNLSAAWHHTRLVRELDQGETPRCSSLSQNVAIALLLALVGLAMAIYLIAVRVPSGIHP
jgi:inner membrane protein YidH